MDIKATLVGAGAVVVLGAGIFGAAAYANDVREPAPVVVEPTVQVEKEAPPVVVTPEPEPVVTPEPEPVVVPEPEPVAPEPAAPEPEPAAPAPAPEPAPANPGDGGQNLPVPGGGGSDTRGPLPGTNP